MLEVVVVVLLVMAFVTVAVVAGLAVRRLWTGSGTQEP